MITKIEIRVVHMCRPCAFSLLVITEGCYESSKTLLQSKSSRFCPIVSSSVKSIPIVCFSVQISSNKATMNSKLTNSLDRTCLWRSLDGVLLSGSNFVLEDLVHCQSLPFLWIKKYQATSLHKHKRIKIKRTTRKTPPGVSKRPLTTVVWFSKKTTG